MSEYIEFEGKNIDKALKKASKELKIPVEQLKYDVISYGSTGIYGLVGIKKAKIRVNVNVETEPVSKDIQDEAKIQARDLVKSTFNLDDTPEEGLEQAVDTGMDVLKRFVDFITEGATVTAETRNGRILYKVEGGNSGLLIGKRGQTLEAMQYLAEKIVNKQNDYRTRVLVDVEGYLSMRKANLRKMASRMADKAKKINKPVTIGQMNAYDRRIVHLHLKDNPGVRTQSVGEGYYRKLIVFPKRRQRKKNTSKGH